MCMACGEQVAVVAVATAPIWVLWLRRIINHVTETWR